MTSAGAIPNTAFKEPKTCNAPSRNSWATPSKRATVHIGTVSDFLFDDATWKVRWLVVDTGHWLTGRKVLIHPSVMGAVDDGRQRVPVKLTKARIKDSPDILQDQPVSRQMESGLYGYYGLGSPSGAAASPA